MDPAFGSARHPVWLPGGNEDFCASTIWGLFLPSTLGGDAIRTISMARAGVDSHEVIASIIIERTIGFLAVLLLGIASLLLFSMSGSFENHFTVAWWVAHVISTGSVRPAIAKMYPKTATVEVGSNL
jgi:uncharacterized membrane protein YbhN (UPF0104 family)